MFINIFVNWHNLYHIVDAAVVVIVNCCYYYYY